LDGKFTNLWGVDGKGETTNKLGVPRMAIPRRAQWAERMKKFGESHTGRQILYKGGEKGEGKKHSIQSLFAVKQKLTRGLKQSAFKVKDGVNRERSLQENECREDFPSPERAREGVTETFFLKKGRVGGRRGKITGRVEKIWKEPGGSWGWP